MGILHRFIEEKQSLNTNLLTNSPIQVSDPFVIRKRGVPSKRLKSSTECNNTPNSQRKRALAPLDVNLRSKNSSNVFIADDKSNKKETTLTENQIQEEALTNKYKCGICGGIGHNSRNKKKCPQQNIL